MTPSALAALAARLVCIGFPGQTPSAELRGLVHRGVRSVILFARNVGTPEEIFELTRELKSLSDEPFVIGVDQEGGSVRRLRAGFTELPPARAIGLASDPELAEAVGALLGRELRAVGIDWDFAPVLDVDSNPQNPVIGARAFGSDPALVASLGVRLAKGLESQSVAACGKHFPGHGDTNLDSHFHLPKLSHDLSRLEAVELVPFAAACEANIASIMVAHVVFSALDSEFPASMSEKVVRTLLRERLGYAGLIVSDDLEMKAIIDHFGIAEAVVRGLNAGVDLFLVCHEPERMHAAIDALIHAVERGTVSLQALVTAERRVSAFFARWAGSADATSNLDALCSPEHLAIAARLRAIAELP